MSRTYRNRSQPPHYLKIVDDSNIWNGYSFTEYNWSPCDLCTEEGRKEIAIWRSDATREFKEPGPSWYRRLFTQRPHRQQARREIYKFMLDEEYEPMILSKPKLEYWT